MARATAPLGSRNPNPSRVLERLPARERETQLQLFRCSAYVPKNLRGFYRERPLQVHSFPVLIPAERHPCRRTAFVLLTHPARYVTICPMEGSREITEHVREIERCNQRGGRFLSIVDLLDAGTVDLDIASLLGASILKGNSFLVGALPGGAGKTTVMGALLNFVPPSYTLAAATEGVPAEGLKDTGPETCFICHEIGQGHYFAYLWGRDIQDFFRLPATRHMAATNLHADTLDQARGIVCSGCGVDEALFSQWPLSVFLDVSSGRMKTKRRVRAVWEQGGRLLRRLDGAGWEQVNEPRSVSSELCEAVGGMLSDLLDRDCRSIFDVRCEVVRRFREGFFPL